LNTITFPKAERTKNEPAELVERVRVHLEEKGIESRPLWKPMHKQPVYKDSPAYVNGVAEEMFLHGMCLPSGPYVTDDDVRYIVKSISEALA
jgi:dTDP-4-amino-4,6-dideoxygalactose transaminase